MLKLYRCIHLFDIGLVPGDEILVINGKIVSELDMVYVETLLQDSHSVCLAVRALQMPPSAVAMETPVTCPPPPSQSRISENSIGNLKIPPPSGSKQILKKNNSQTFPCCLIHCRPEIPKGVL